MRAALQVSIHLSFYKAEYKPLNYKEVFHLATLGGAEGKRFKQIYIELSIIKFI
jgi:hypothetical protein